jgi:hypothetical protein
MSCIRLLPGCYRMTLGIARLASAAVVTQASTGLLISPIGSASARRRTRFMPVIPQ